MDEELFQRICKEVETILELHYPEDLNQRLAVAGMVHAALMYTTIRMLGRDEDELLAEETSYLKDLLMLMKRHPDAVKISIVGVH
jgi:hypothetical protein